MDGKPGNRRKRGLAFTMDGFCICSTKFIRENDVAAFLHWPYVREEEAENWQTFLKGGSPPSFGS